MKLFYAPGACSLSDHIAMHEAGMSFEHERVDLKTKRTASGVDYTTINPKGYVPALMLDSGKTLSENIAILDWIAGQYPELGLSGPLGRTSLLETLAYISTEIHKAFRPFFSGAAPDEKSKAGDAVLKRMSYLAERMQGEFLFGANLSVADCYLFVMLLWAKQFSLTPPTNLVAFRDRMMERPAVHKAMKHEGLI